MIKLEKASHLWKKGISTKRTLLHKMKKVITYMAWSMI